MRRLFLGLELPLSIKRKLLRLQGNLPGARWQTAEQLHLTLRFIGSVDEPREQAIRAIMARLRFAPFEIALQGMGRFGSGAHPRALWAGVVPEAPLAALNRRIERRLSAIGLPPGTSPFKPHVTLARFGRRAGPLDEFMAAHGSFVTAAFPVRQVSLFLSITEESGACYRVIDRFPLAR
jgi:2'-5' RNA ligase